MKRKILLIIMDGWGIAKNKKVSAIDRANIPFYDEIMKKYPNSKLEASGLSVGLPEGQMGNSEVGHTNLGAGRIVYQKLVKINRAIENKLFQKDEKILELLKYVRDNNKNLHLLGLVSDGGVHSHINHLKEIINLADKFGIKNTFIHAFTDGRDCAPKTAINFMREIENYVNDKTAIIATITGRYYAMDRDNRWDRVKRAYENMVWFNGNKEQNPSEAILNSYKNAVYDEFIEPVTIVDHNRQPVFKMENGDGMIFFNFRPDRVKQLSTAFSSDNFREFDTKKMNLKILTMTSYGVDNDKIKVIFEDDNLKNTLGEVLEKNNKKQIRIAETEKYPHVTYFFSGGREKEFLGEKRILCPSPKVATYDLKPEMSAWDITNSIISEIEKKEADFICLNFANPDMVGHTGDMKATIKACETVNDCLEKLIPCANKNNYTSLVLSDHGNSDCMVNEDGSPNTYHSTQPVPCILIDNKNEFTIRDGVLGDISPTILELMGVEKPKEMQCESLLVKNTK